MLAVQFASIDLREMLFNMAAALSSSSWVNFGVKSSNNSDSWQDANTALAELDKGAFN